MRTPTSSILLSLVALGCSSGHGGGGFVASTAPAATTPPPPPAPPATRAPAPVASSTPTAPPAPRLPVLVVVGLAQEAQIAQGPGVIVVMSDSDPAHLRALLASFQASSVRAVVSFGIAGGLDVNTVPGTLMVANEVVATAGGQTWTPDPALSAEIMARLQAGNVPASFGLFAGSDTLSADDTPAAKLATKQATGADEVDMESHIAAAFAQANALPFAALRAVADPQSVGLPPAALLPIQSNGQPDILAILGSVVTDPSQIPLLLQTYADSQASFTALQ